MKSLIEIFKEFQQYVLRDYEEILSFYKFSGDFLLNNP